MPIIPLLPAQPALAEKCGKTYNPHRYIAAVMENKRKTIPIREGLAPDQNDQMINQFPDAVAFTEITDDENDFSEQREIFSFDSLRNAFAAIRKTETELAETITGIGGTAGQEPEYAEQPDYEWNETAAESEESAHDESGSVSGTEPMPDTGLRTVVEAVLFVGNKENKPVLPEQIAEKLRNVSAEEVVQEMILLNEHYRQQGRPLVIVPEKNAYRMTLRPEFFSIRTNFYGTAREVRLSQAAVDTLAIVAYRQPVTAEEIQKIRRQPAAAVLNQLVRRGLLQVSWKSEEKKKTAVYRTASRFLELLRIQSLGDLPQAGDV
ncbi:MAG: SMC-Scp complex subunit ScpB [Planctomycetaceae bacterium]|nr:SMC-Scp complex subunit ScpB [Planctomycetaceae bacterium]